MVDLSALRTLLVLVLTIGALAATGPQPTVSAFSNAHDGTGSWTASDNFQNNAGGVTADGGGPYTVDEGGQLILDASGSSADQGTIQSYSWDLLSGPGSGWYYPSQSWAVYNPPDDVSGTTQAVVELTVTDNKGRTDTDTVTITIQDTNGASTGSASATSTGNGATRKGGGTRETF